MKKVEAIKRLLDGDEIMLDTGPRYLSANFRNDWATVRYDTARQLAKDERFKLEKSLTAQGIEYLKVKS